MASTQKGTSFFVKPYIGDSKTLLAFNFASESDAHGLAGFTIECKPPGLPACYLDNELQLEDPARHHQVAGHGPRSSINAPVQQYRWIHVPDSHSHGPAPTGPYVYTVTPRYFDSNHCLTPPDPALGVRVTVPVGPFRKGALSLGFTRGYLQSEAFAQLFGEEAVLVPAGKPLLFDTRQKAATGPSGQSFTFAEEYAWAGGTARPLILALLNSVRQDRTLQLSVFASDLDEPDLARILLELAAQGRVRIILDDSAEARASHPQDPFAEAFALEARAPAAIVRGSFGRHAHENILIVSRDGVATQVLTGSTRFCLTGLYVSAHHVVLLDDPGVAGEYAQVFEQSWQLLKELPGKKSAEAFSSMPLATRPFTTQANGLPRLSITFSPHTAAVAGRILSGVCERIRSEAQAAHGSLLFAVTQLPGSKTPVYQTLSELHDNRAVFCHGIADEPGTGTHLYAPGSRKGVLVTGQPGSTSLPPPFDQAPLRAGHELHDHLIVCGLNGPDPVVYCGSSDLATGGEQENADNLLEIHDPDVAAAFAIEVLLLVDHYSFLDRHAAARPARGVARAKPKRVVPEKRSARKKNPRTPKVVTIAASKTPRRKLPRQTSSRRTRGSAA